jgi:two-component system, chemotaxis family, sensor kinase CheA
VSDEFNFSTGMPSDEMAEYLQMFVDETSEQLDDLVEVLLVLETNPSSPSHLNESFRLIHSIKGAAAMMGLDSISLLTHHLENHFEHLRSGSRTLNRPMMNLILRCVDFLRSAVGKLRDGVPLVSAPELIEQLSLAETELPTVDADAANATPNSASSTESVAPASFQTESPDSRSPRNALKTQRRIIAYLDRSIELPELKAQLILARLSDLAIVDRTSPDIDALDSLAELRTLQIWLESTCHDDELRAAVDIVGVELIEIDLLHDDLLSDGNTPDDTTRSASTDVESADGNHALAQEPTFAAEGNLASQPDHSLGLDHTTRIADDAPVPSSVETSHPAEASPVSVATVRTSTATLAPTIAQEATATPVLEASPAMESASIETQSKVVETVRVDIQRLDRLMNLAGELVVNRARFVQLASQMTETFKKSGLLSQLRDLCESLREQLATGNKPSSRPDGIASVDDRYREIQSTVAAFEEQLKVLELGRRSFIQLNEAIDHFSRVSDGLQRGVLDTRMVPVGPLFNRFKRTVRDISAELGKKVNFVIHGENTELDKRMIDELGDPLVHLVRNAIDHGLESESIRRSRGKPEFGTLTLEAAHSGNNVLITISDDGGGIHVEKVKRRAIERGIVTSTEAEMMSDREIALFIWAPGFSTAEVVSDISGRGVGMDIVKTRISELNGTIEVDSALGKGTKFVIRLPLTLAIIRSLLFDLKHGTFAAPIENVREIVSVHNRDILSVHGRNSIEVRGEFIPLVSIDDVFDWHGTQYAYGLGMHSIGSHQQGGEPHESEAEPEHGVQPASVLILTSGSKSMGLVVSQLKGCQDIVVKSLDENFTDIRGLAGASILGDGSVCLLLDVTACLELARQRLRAKSPSGATANA